MIIFVDCNMNFAVHVSDLNFIKKITMENDKKKAKQKQMNERKGKRKISEVEEKEEKAKKKNFEIIGK